MKTGLDSSRVGAWLSGEGRDADIIISSRIRLARNIEGVPFLLKASSQEQLELLAHVDRALTSIFPANVKGLVKLEDLTPLEAEFLLERHLVSPFFLQSQIQRGFFASADESFSLMANEEDHLRMQMFGSGLSLKELWDKMEGIEEKLNAVLPFSYDDRYGFLTACPTNVGTGMRASLLIHLPGVVLTKEIDRVLRGVLQLGLLVRGTYGEGTETKGYLFQISNQRTLGQSESEIVDTLTKTAEQLVNYEKDARRYLENKMGTYISDKVYRSFGILKYARRLSSEETFNLISTLRLSGKRIENIDTAKLNRLMILTKPANLQLYFGQDMTPELRDLKRADLIRESLADAEP